MTGLAERLATAKAESALEEARTLDELERRLRWLAPAGIGLSDLWKRLGCQGDVAGLRTRLQALEEQKRAQVIDGLWYHGAVRREQAQAPQALAATGTSATHTPQVSDGVAARRARILELLAAHPEGLKCAAVQREIGASQSTIYNDLMRLQHHGQTRSDHNDVWRLAPPTPPPPSQTDVVAPCTEEPAPPPTPATVEIVAEGEVVAVVPEPEPEPDARPDPLALLADLAAAAETIERARREIAEHTADALIGEAFEEIAAFAGCPDYTDPAAVARAVVEREEELTSRLAAASEEASALRAELERVRAALRTLAAGGGS